MPHLNKRSAALASALSLLTLSGNEPAVMLGCQRSEQLISASRFHPRLQGGGLDMGAAGTEGVSCQPPTKELKAARTMVRHRRSWLSKTCQSMIMYHSGVGWQI
jgi:hypothetical protein